MAITDTTHIVSHTSAHTHRLTHCLTKGQRDKPKGYNGHYKLFQKRERKIGLWTDRDREIGKRKPKETERMREGGCGG